MKRSLSLLGLGLLAAATLVPVSALAQTQSSTRLLDARRDAPLVRGSLGLRGQWFGSPGRDPFTNGDFSPQVTLGADATLLRTRRLSLAAGVAWDVGGASGEARGIETSLVTHRLTIPLEARWHWTRSIYGFFRAAPGFSASVARARNLDPSAGTYSDTRYAFATDLSVGVAFGLSPQPKNGSRGVRLWLLPELGYALAGKTSFDLTPPSERPDSDVRLPGSTLPTHLPGFSPSGPFFRVSLALGF